MKLNLVGYEHLVGVGPFAMREEIAAFAGISGGRTSAMMAALLDPRVRLCFQNTGKEDYRTLLFLERLQDALEREITWLEWRPPARHGAPPREFRFEIVTSATATRNSPALFVALFEALNAYRETKGEPPVIAWARQRLCTAYLKHRTMEAWIKSLGYVNARGGLDAIDWFVGLRADEPDRVAKLRAQERGGRRYRTPLDDVGITKYGSVGGPIAVNPFWARQSFDLELDSDADGNCGGCFLKDEADIARAKQPEHWIEIENRWPGFGGHGRWTYAQLAAEREPRLAIERALRAGEEPVDDGRMLPRRFQLVVRQETRRLREGSSPFTCACEQTVALAGADDEEEDAA